MKIEFALLLFILTVSGCKNQMQIPTHDMGLEFDYKHLDYENQDKSIDRNLLQQIREIDELSEPKLVCLFNSAFGKDVFKVYLVESKAESSSVSALLVTDYLSKKIIDYYDFNTDTVFLDLLYDRTDSIEGNSLVFSFVNLNTNNNNIITTYDKSINLEGVFGGGKVRGSNKYTFQLLDSIKRYSGNYFYETDSFHISLKLKDGIEKGHYAFKFSLQTPKHCVTTHTHLKGILENERFFFEFEPEISILLSNDTLKMNLELNQKECGVIVYQTIELKKNN